MQIELWYDAVACETDILINGAPVDKNDAYGFLYPVRNYPFQSWLWPNGSWKGLTVQITDLARDEKVELIFHGRECDFADLSRCLQDQPGITAVFSPWDVLSRYNGLYSLLISTLESNDAHIRALAHSLKLPFDFGDPLAFDESSFPWACHIRSQEDLEAADDMEQKRCCFVHESFLTGYDRLQALAPLTRSLKLPADAIYCLLGSEQALKDYLYYAASYKRMNFCFALEDSPYLEEAREKYALPALVRQKIEACRSYTESLGSRYLALKDSIQEEFNRLKKNIVHLSAQEKDRYDLFRQLRTCTSLSANGMQQIRSYLDTLFSVTRDNKEEVCHYECLDKLDENIRLYLNENSWMGGM